MKDENADLRKMNELHVERLKQLEEQAEFHSVKFHVSTSDQTLVKELDEKYNSLKCKYERIVTQETGFFISKEEKSSLSS